MNIITLLMPNLPTFLHQHNGCIFYAFLFAFLLSNSAWQNEIIHGTCLLHSQLDCNKQLVQYKTYLYLRKTLIDIATK